MTDEEFSELIKMEPDISVFEVNNDVALIITRCPQNYHLRGYIAFSPSHPFYSLYKKDASNEYNVYGGITFQGKSPGRQIPVRYKDWYFIGMDGSHEGDYSHGRSRTDEDVMFLNAMAGIQNNSKLYVGHNGSNCVYVNLNFIHNELINLYEQIKNELGIKEVKYARRHSTIERT